MRTGVTVGVGISVGVRMGTDVGVGGGVGSSVGVDVGIGVMVGTGVGVYVGIGDGVDVGSKVGVASANRSRDTICVGVSTAWVVGLELSLAASRDALGNGYVIVVMATTTANRMLMRLNFDILETPKISKRVLLR